MMRTKLISTVLQIKNGSVLVRRSVAPQIICSPRYATSKGSNKEEDKDEYNQPITFSTSPAAKMPAAFMTASARGYPWYQGVVISLSFMVLILYFAVLREESDIDQKLAGNMASDFDVFMKDVKTTGQREKDISHK